MGMTGFSDAEMALLSGLDAVAWVTRTRITYTDSFKREAVTLNCAPEVGRGLLMVPD